MNAASTSRRSISSRKPSTSRSVGTHPRRGGPPVRIDDAHTSQGRIGPMRDAAEDPEHAPNETERVLSCTNCGRHNRPTMEELLNYTRLGWPRCCGEVMALSVRAAGQQTAQA